MNKIKFRDFRKKVSYFTLVLFAIFLLPGCARKFAFSNSHVVPAAEGSVKVKKGKNDNYKIDLNIIRLAESERLTPPKNTYVVWMQTKQNGTKNIGQLKSSSGFLSKMLKSSLETVTSFEPESFFITAEDNASVQYPNGKVVLRTSPSR